MMIILYACYYNFCIGNNYGYDNKNIYNFKLETKNLYLSIFSSFPRSNKLYQTLSASYRRKFVIAIYLCKYSRHWHLWSKKQVFRSTRCDRSRKQDTIIDNAMLPGIMPSTFSIAALSESDSAGIRRSRSSQIGTDLSSPVMFSTSLARRGLASSRKNARRFSPRNTAHNGAQYIRRSRAPVTECLLEEVHSCSISLSAVVTPTSITPGLLSCFFKKLAALLLSRDRHRFSLLVNLQIEITGVSERHAVTHVCGEIETEWWIAASGIVDANRTFNCRIYIHKYIHIYIYAYILCVYMYVFIYVLQSKFEIRKNLI